MKKNLFLRIASAALAAVLLSVMFFMSATPAEKSSKLSQSVSEIIGSLFNKNREGGSGGQSSYPKSIERTVRKTAHFIEFLLLGALIRTICTVWDVKRLYAVIITVSAGVMSAAADELHQYFVPGRACMFKDVLIDSAGVVAGLLIAAGITALIRRKKTPERPSGE